MKTGTDISGKIKANIRFIIRNKSVFALALILLTGLSGCEVEYGYDGRPGNAYLALQYDVAEPYYLDAGTGAIPAEFIWGDFYYATSGYYTLYYEGSHWNGHRWADYAWEIDYEIYNNPGEYGGAYYNGKDGADSYFTLLCSPYGPDFFQNDINYRKDNNPDTSVTKMPDTGSMVKTVKNYSIKMTWKKVSPRAKATSAGASLQTQ
jgi:hypothetical protein